MRFPMVALLGVLSGVPASGEVPDKQAVQKPAKKAVTVYIEGDTSTIPPKMRHFQGGAFLERNQASSADASVWPNAVRANRVRRLLPSGRPSVRNLVCPFQVTAGGLREGHSWSLVKWPVYNTSRPPLTGKPVLQRHRDGREQGWPNH